MKYRDFSKDDSMTIIISLLNNTPECEETEEYKKTGTIADISHMWTRKNNRREG